MPDHSFLDAKYFVDRSKFNCPYCNRRHVAYQIENVRSFDWNDTKKCWVIFVKCQSCGNESMHLSSKNITSYVGRGYVFDSGIEIDDEIFYSVPSSFFVVDSRIPRELRELLAEAEGCLKSNFLTGASACVRKVVYELALKMDAEGDHYDDRIKSLKAKLPSIDPTYFDTLLTIQEVTSDKVHEDSYDGWESKHLRLILSSLLEILNEIFVVPALREEKRKSILTLKSEVLDSKKQTDDGAA